MGPGAKSEKMSHDQLLLTFLEDEAKKPEAAEEDLEAEKDNLHAKIGQQAIEIDFLRKKSKQLGL